MFRVFHQFLDAAGQAFAFMSENIDAFADMADAAGFTKGAGIATRLSRIGSEIVKNIQELPTTLKNIEKALSEMVNFQLNSMLPSAYTSPANHQQLYQAKQRLYKNLFTVISTLHNALTLYALLPQLSKTIEVGNLSSIISRKLSEVATYLNNIGILNKSEQDQVNDFMSHLSQTDPDFKKTREKLKEAGVLLKSCAEGNITANSIEEIYTVINSLLCVRNIFTAASHYQMYSAIRDVENDHETAIIHARGTATLFNRNIDPLVRQYQEAFGNSAVIYLNIYSRFTSLTALFLTVYAKQDIQSTVSLAGKAKHAAIDSLFVKIIQPFLTQLFASAEWNKENEQERRAMIAAWCYHLNGSSAKYSEFEKIIENIVCNLYLHSTQKATHYVVPPIAEWTMLTLWGLCIGTHSNRLDQMLLYLAEQVAFGVLAGRYILAPAIEQYGTYEVHQHVTELRASGEIIKRFRQTTLQVLNNYFLNPDEEKLTAEQQTSIPANIGEAVYTYATGAKLLLNYGPSMVGFSGLSEPPRPISARHQRYGQFVRNVGHAAYSTYEGAKTVAHEIIETVKFDVRLVKSVYGYAADLVKFDIALARQAPSFVNQYILQPIGNWLNHFRHQSPVVAVTEPKPSVEQEQKSVVESQAESVSTTTRVLLNFSRVSAKDDPLKSLTAVQSPVAAVNTDETKPKKSSHNKFVKLIRQARQKNLRIEENQAFVDRATIPRASS